MAQPGPKQSLSGSKELLQSLHWRSEGTISTSAERKAARFRSASSRFDRAFRSASSVGALHRPHPSCSGYSCGRRLPGTASDGCGWGSPRDVSMAFPRKAGRGNRAATLGEERPATAKIGSSPSNGPRARSAKTCPRGRAKLPQPLGRNKRPGFLPRPWAYPIGGMRFRALPPFICSRKTVQARTRFRLSSIVSLGTKPTICSATLPPLKISRDGIPRMP